MADAKLPSEPTALILFDGVCNLCNAWVLAVIDRDRRARFRFASLQSDAGRRAIHAAGAEAQLHEQPQSLVLIDPDGLHLRSEAVLRVAAGLGFPWSWLVLGRILPRGLRDAVYDTIARRRFRWFGRTQSCRVPTPELRARFLDADEPPRIVAEAEVVASGPERLASVATIPRALAERALLVYLLVYSLRVPLGVIPGTEGWATAYQRAASSAVTWIASACLDIEIEDFQLGSGDTTLAYVTMAVQLSLSLLVAIAGTLLARGAAPSMRVRRAMHLYVRMVLAAAMLDYGWHKLIPLQMPPPGPDRLLVPIGDTSPMGLVWTMMGASTTYQQFAGASEVLGGLLLLWPRTAFAGALVSAAVMTQVVALNFCFDIPVKLYSSHLLGMAVFVAAPRLARLLVAVGTDLPLAAHATAERFPQPRPTWGRVSLALVKAGFVWVVAVQPAISNATYLRSEGWRAPRSMRHGFYTVESFAQGGATDAGVAASRRWTQVGINDSGTAAIVRADGSGRRVNLAFDDDAGIAVLTPRDDPNHPTTFRFEAPGPDLLRLEGHFEGAPIQVLLRKRPDPDHLLIQRGFHWINEYPLNR